ncbi:MAG: hypothetical protein IKP21_06725 [Bacteroidales bacterium]|nr:hypothetical protein [Bacteroidales bacterium]
MITIDDSNYELWLLRYAEQELTTEEREAVEAWLAEHPEAAEELALYIEAPRLQRDESVSYAATPLQHIQPLWPAVLRWSAAAAVVAALMVPAIGGITEMESGEWRVESGEVAQADLNEELIIKNEELPEEVRSEVPVVKAVARPQEELVIAEAIEETPSAEPALDESEKPEVLPTVPEVIYTDNLIVYEQAPDTVYTDNLIVYDDSRRSWTEDVKDWAAETNFAQWVRRRFKAREAELLAMNE